VGWGGWLLCGTERAFPAFARMAAFGVLRGKFFWSGSSNLEHKSQIGAHAVTLWNDNMKDFCQLILQHEKKVNELHSQVWETFRRREKSAHAHSDWEQAAKQFCEFGSEFDELVERSLSGDMARDNELRGFALSYVATDPYFFRSGYILERLVRRIKKLDLSDAEKATIQKLILRRIDTKALRNFRDICRLIPKVETTAFSNEIAERLRSSEPGVRHRAELAASYLAIQGKVRGDGFEMRQRDVP